MWIREQYSKKDYTENRAEEIEVEQKGQFCFSSICKSFDRTSFLFYRFENQWLLYCLFFFMRNIFRVSGRTGNHTCKHAHWHSCADSANFSAAVAFAEDETLTSKVPNMLLVVVALAHFHWRHIWRELVSQNCVDVRTFMFKTAPNQSL